jgi:hypothetical protein
VTVYKFPIRPARRALAARPTSGLAARRFSFFLPSHRSQLIQLREGVGSTVDAAEATYGYTANGKRPNYGDSRHKALIAGLPDLTLAG